MLKLYKTCQREHVNKRSQHFLHAKCRVNNFWTALFSIFTMGMGNWKNAIPFSLQVGSKIYMYYAMTMLFFLIMEFKYGEGWVAKVA